MGVVCNAYYSHRGPFLEMEEEAFRKTFEATAQMVRNLDRRALAVHADVSQRNQVEAMIKKVIVELGRIDIVVCNVSQLAARHMVDRGGGGRFIFIGSVMALYPQAIPTSVPYNAAKAALDNMTRTIATDLAQHRVTVNLIRPGWIDTAGERKFTSEEDMRRLSAHLPLGIGKPIDIAKGACFLASSDAEYVTGETLTIDGGFGLATRIPNIHAPMAMAKAPVHTM